MNFAERLGQHVRWLRDHCCSRRRGLRKLQKRFQNRRQRLRVFHHRSVQAFPMYCELRNQARSPSTDLARGNWRRANYNPLAKIFPGHPHKGVAQAARCHPMNDQFPYVVDAAHRVHSILSCRAALPAQNLNSIQQRILHQQIPLRWLPRRAAADAASELLHRRFYGNRQAATSIARASNVGAFLPRHRQHAPV